MDLTRTAEPINGEIAPTDSMFGGNREHYLGVGLSALRCIRLGLLATDAPEPQRILDLPCGWGRVTRALRAAYPRAEITACDLDTAGVDFCAQAFGARGVYSSTDLSQVRLDRDFDLIWVGSLFTHLNDRAQEDFLSFFDEHLAPGGTIVFTTHGRRVLSWIAAGRSSVGIAVSTLYGLPAESLEQMRGEALREGFSYRDYPNQQGYGISLSLPSHVVSRVERRLSLCLSAYIEYGWDGHQDVIVCRSSRLHETRHR